MPSNPIFAPDLDAAHILKEVAAQHRLTYPPIPFYKRNRDVGSFDDLYGEEEVADILSGVRYDIPAHRKINPPRKLWERWGLTTLRDIYVVFSVQVLREGYDSGGMVIVPYPYIEIGDLVLSLNQEFAFTDVFRKEFHGNTGIPTEIHCFGLRVRETWAPGGDTVDIGDDNTDGTPPPPDSGGRVDDDDLL